MTRREEHDPDHDERHRGGEQEKRYSADARTLVAATVNAIRAPLSPSLAGCTVGTARSPVVTRSVAALLPVVVPHAFAAAELVVLCLLEPAADAADRFRVRDALEDREECNGGDCDPDDHDQASASAASASHRARCVREDKIVESYPRRFSG
jgi:hypothetical protein